MELPPASPAEPTASAETEKEYSRMTEAQWAEAESLYERGVMSGAEICEKFAIKPSTWKMRLWRRKRDGRPIIRNSKVEEVKKEIEKEVGEAAAKPSLAAKFALERRNRIDALRESGYVTANNIQVLLRKTLQDSIDKTTGKVVASEHDANVKTLQRINKTFIDNFRALKLDILEADKDIDEKTLPQLVFRDLSEEDLEIIRRNNGEDDDLEDAIVTPEDDGVVEEGV